MKGVRINLYCVVCSILPPRRTTCISKGWRFVEVIFCVCLGGFADELIELPGTTRVQIFWRLPSCRILKWIFFIDFIIPDQQSKREMQAHLQDFGEGCLYWLFYGWSKVEKREGEVGFICTFQPHLATTLWCLPLIFSTNIFKSVKNAEVCWVLNLCSFVNLVFVKECHRYADWYFVLFDLCGVSVLLILHVVMHWFWIFFFCSMHCSKPPNVPLRQALSIY